MSGKRARGAGKRLNDAQRLVIIRRSEEVPRPSNRQLAREYEVSEKTIRKIILAKDEIAERTTGRSEEVRLNTFRRSVARFPELEDRLYEWIQALRIAKMEVSPMIIISKALKVAADMGISAEDFSASWGWLRKFRLRKGLQSMLLHGEGAEVDRDDPALLASLDLVYDLISQYDPENVYNEDETGLFFRLLPRYTILMPYEDVSTTRGKKKSKDRVTLCVCANSTGSHKIPCTMVGKAARPACISGKTWPLPYYNQKRAWIDGPVFTKWLDEVFIPLVRRRTSEPVLLMLDNAPGHMDEFVKDGVSISFFPTNCTSWKQPMDMGIIAALKKRYKFLMMKDIVDFFDLPEDMKDNLYQSGSQLRRGTAGVSYGRPAHLLDAAKYIVRAWDDITPTTIRNCFDKAQIMGWDQEDVKQDEDSDSDVEQIVELIRNIGSEEDAKQLREEIEEFLKLDDENSAALSEVLLEDIELALADDEEEPVVENDASEEDVEPPTEVDLTDLLARASNLMDSLSSEGFKEIAGSDRFTKITESMDVVHRKLVSVLADKRRKAQKNLSQATLHQMFNKN